MKNSRGTKMFGFVYFVKNIITRIENRKKHLYIAFQPSRLLKTWINEFLIKVIHYKPQFIGLHLQEVGGKTYEKSMEYVQEFIKILCESTELQSYDRIRVYLDEDYTSAENFTVSAIRTSARFENNTLLIGKRKKLFNLFV